MRGVYAVAGGQDASGDGGRGADPAVSLAHMVRTRVDVEGVDLEPAGEAVELFDVLNDQVVALDKLANALGRVRAPRPGVQWVCLARYSSIRASSAPGGPGTKGRSSRSAATDAAQPDEQGALNVEVVAQELLGDQLVGDVATAVGDLVPGIGLGDVVEELGAAAVALVGQHVGNNVVHRLRQRLPGPRRAPVGLGAPEARDNRPLRPCLKVLLEGRPALPLQVRALYEVQELVHQLPVNLGHPPPDVSRHRRRRQKRLTA